MKTFRKSYLFDEVTIVYANAGKQYFIIVVSLALSSLAVFVSPIGIYQVLKSVIRLSNLLVNIRNAEFYIVISRQVGRSRISSPGSGLHGCSLAQLQSLRAHTGTCSM